MPAVFFVPIKARQTKLDYEWSMGRWAKYGIIVESFLQEEHGDGEQVKDIGRKYGWIMFISCDNT